MIWLCYIIMLAVPYLMAGINFSIIVCKLKTGKDIRTLGSGNAGLTNAVRVLGKPLGGIVLVGDVSKAALGVFLVKLSFNLLGGINTSDVTQQMKWVEYMAVFMATFGHCFPLYYGFRGGKGVLAAVSGIFVLDFRIALILLGIFIIIVAISKYVSLGSIISSSCFWIASMLFGLYITHDSAWIANSIIAAFCGLLIIVRHKANIGRLINHNEKKFGEKSKGA